MGALRLQAAGDRDHAASPGGFRRQRSFSAHRSRECWAQLKADPAARVAAVPESGPMIASATSAWLVGALCGFVVDAALVLAVLSAPRLRAHGGRPAPRGW